MPWPPNGDYYGFKEDAIKRYAPPVSGVYGIYNFHHHILIAHSNNIREALLRHQRGTKFRFRRLQPTGFTFETCPIESKEFRAQELIWEYEPILHDHGNIGLTAWWRSWLTPRPSAFHSAETFKLTAMEGEGKLDQTPAPDKPRAEHARTRRDEYAMLILGITFAVVAIALYMLLGEHRTIAESWTRQLFSLAQSVTAALSDKPHIAPSPPPAIIPRTPASRTDAPIVLPKKQHASTSKIGSVIVSAESMGNIDARGAIDFAGTPTFNKSESRRGWTVQALATTDWNDAKYWLDRLKVKSYHAYIVEAKMNGIIWYRVRVGNLQSRREADELGRTLRTHERFSHAFVATSEKSDIVTASNHPSSHVR